MSKIRKWWATRKKVPYVEIVSEGGNTKDGFSLELDWNDYFIEELAKYGIEGSSDEEMVRLWLERIRQATDFDLYQQKILEMAEKQNQGEE